MVGWQWFWRYVKVHARFHVTVGSVMWEQLSRRLRGVASWETTCWTRARMIELSVPRGLRLFAKSEVNIPSILPQWQKGG
jgi:hypothetical protein